MWDARIDPNYRCMKWDVTNSEFIGDFRIHDIKEKEGVECIIVTHGSEKGELMLPNKLSVDSSTWCDIVSEMFPRLHNRHVKVIACYEDKRVNDDDEFQALNPYGTTFDVTPLGARDPSYSGTYHSVLTVAYIKK